MKLTQDQIKILKQELAEIDKWLDNRPSSSMDVCIEERDRKVQRFYEIKHLIRENNRPPNRDPSFMMAAQQMPEQAPEQH